MCVYVCVCVCVCVCVLQHYIKQRFHPGGANVPALNDLLSSWGIAFSSEVVEGETVVNDHKLHYASGTAIARFPEDGLLLARDLNHQGMLCSSENYHQASLIRIVTCPEESLKCAIL